MSYDHVSDGDIDDNDVVEAPPRHDPAAPHASDGDVDDPDVAELEVALEEEGQSNCNDGSCDL